MWTLNYNGWVEWVKPGNCIEEWPRPLDRRVDFYHTLVNTHMHRVTHIQKACKCTHTGSIQMHTQQEAFKCTDTCTYTQTHKLTHKLTHKHTQTHTDTHTDTQTHTQTHIETKTQTHTDTLTHGNTHTHTERNMWTLNYNGWVEWGQTSVLCRMVETFGFYSGFLSHTGLMQTCTG